MKDFWLLPRAWGCWILNAVPWHFFLREICFSALFWCWLPISSCWRLLLLLILAFCILVPSAECFTLRKVLFFWVHLYFAFGEQWKGLHNPSIINSNPKRLLLIRYFCLVSCGTGLQQALNSQSLCRLQSALSQTQSSDFRYVEQWAKAWGFRMDYLPPVEILKKARWNKTLHSCDCSHLEWIMSPCAWSYVCNGALLKFMVMS